MVSVPTTPPAQLASSICHLILLTKPFSTQMLIKKTLSLSTYVHKYVHTYALLKYLLFSYDLENKAKINFMAYTALVHLSDSIHLSPSFSMPLQYLRCCSLNVVPPEPRGFCTCSALCLERCSSYAYLTPFS